MKNIEEIKIQEATASIDIAGKDENLSADQMFQESNVESLARQICAVVPIHGPTGALFNIRKKPQTNDFELIRSEVEVLTSVPVNTGISQEAIQDMKNTFGKDYSQVIGKMFRGIANGIENNALFTFLDANSKDYGSLTLSDSKNAEVNLFEITQRVHEIILKMNRKSYRTYDSFAIIPAVPLAGIMGLRGYAGASLHEQRGLFIAQLGQTKFYLNPDPDSVTGYIGCKDEENPSQSSITFSPYQSSIIPVQNPDTGNVGNFLINRFAITKSPLDILNDEMLYKFDIII